MDTFTSRSSHARCSARNNSIMTAEYCIVQGCTKNRQAWRRCKRHAEADTTLPRCTYPACGRTERAKGHCFTHYDQQRKGIELKPIVDYSALPCRGPLCQKSAEYRTGYCESHHRQKRDRGVIGVIGYRRKAEWYRLEKTCVELDCESTEIVIRSRCLDHAQVGVGECWLSWCSSPGHEHIGLCDEHRSRERSMRHSYGIGWQRRLQMSAEQNGECAICGDAEDLTETGGGHHIDHDHATGRIRGLLCGPCNRAIGLLQHDADRLINAIGYLRSTTREV